MKHAIEIHGLKKTFSSFTLGPLSLAVPRGAIYGFIGPNGAGKSTTIDLMLGMGRNDAGTIRILGLDHVEEEVAIKRRVGYVSPELNYATWKTIGKAIRFVRGFYDSWDDDYCLHLLKRLKLNANDSIAHLSFGARTKLSLLMALSHRPEILILDEPTTGLDAVGKQEMFGELLHLVEDENRTVFISSHGLTDLERFCDHLGLIKDGQLLLEGRMDQVVERFCVMDLEGDPASILTSSEGIRYIRRDLKGSRVLVDEARLPLETLSMLKSKAISTTSITLEDLFIHLVKEPNELVA